MAFDTMWLRLKLEDGDEYDTVREELGGALEDGRDSGLYYDVSIEFDGRELIVVKDAASAILNLVGEIKAGGDPSWRLDTIIEQAKAMHDYAG